MGIFPSISRHRGFTLLEMVLAIATLSILGFASMNISLSYRSTSDLQLTSSAFAQTMRRAQTLAANGVAGAAWGVQVRSDSIILFKGTDYATRDTSYDEVYTVPQTVRIPGSLPSGPVVTPPAPIPTLTYIYQPYTGTLVSGGFVTMIAPETNDSFTLTINAQGVIFY